MSRDGCKKLTKKKAVFIILGSAVLLAAIVLLCSKPDGGLDSTEARVEYLAGLGWEVDPDSESMREIILPQDMSGVIAQYNALQKSRASTWSPTQGNRLKATHMS